MKHNEFRKKFYFLNLNHVLFRVTVNFARFVFRYALVHCWMGIKIHSTNYYFCVMFLFLFAVSSALVCISCVMFLADVKIRIRFANSHFERMIWTAFEKIHIHSLFFTWNIPENALHFSHEISSVWFSVLVLVGYFFFLLGLCC